MKKYILVSLLSLGLSAFAQTAPTTLNINLKNGSTVSYTITDIEKITFAEDTEEPPVTEPTAFKFSVPASFASSYVQKVMYNGKQIAEIDQEYILAIKKQVVVVYPCDETGKADLSKGITTDGATVVWNTSTNKATVGEDAEAVSEFYIVDGELLTTYADATADATVEPDLLVDKRGSETNSYRIVKVGTQYWMADNLRAAYYADGTAIDSYTEAESDGWKANTTGAYLNYGDKTWVNYAGRLYSGYAVINESGLAPEGWEIPTQAQWSALKTAGGSQMANFKDADEMSWAAGGAGTNITGFSVVATGYYTTGTELSGLNTEAYFWSSTMYYDTLERGNVIDYARFTATGTNMVVSTSISGGHSLRFGHTVRCIRK